MGNSGSKTEQHVFNADAPVRLSQSVVNSLQNSSETDSTRAQDIELKIQARVNAELTRIRDAQAQQLESRTASLTTDAPPDTNAPRESSSSNSLASHLYHAFGSSTPAEKQDSKTANRSHDSVSKEITELRAKLDARAKVDKMSPAVEKAQESLVRCLRRNDRRPLDCWQEVEEFKAEVGKLEQAFIQKTSR